MPAVALSSFPRSAPRAARWRPMLAELAARRPALGVIGAAAAGTLGIVLLPADWQASPAAEFIAWAAA
ncbi:MAG: hypothetical protein AAB368_00655, partial [bacterium]